MKRRFLAYTFAALSVSGFVDRSILSQVIKINESTLTPYKSTDSGAQQSAVPSAYLYVAVRPGPSGTLSRSDSGGGNVTVTTATAFAYPSLDFVISAASQLIAEGSSSNNAASASKALAEVSRINAHVKIEALDASRAPFTANDSEPPVLVLTIAPEEVAFGQGNPSNRAAEIATGVEFATRFMGPLGDLVSAFQASHKNNRAPTQIAYQSSDNEFGWTWYESPDTPIEGLHRCAALLQVPLKAAYLHVSVDLITDWRHFGPWKKSFAFEVPVVPGTRKE